MIVKTDKEILRDLVAINTIADKNNKEIMDYIQNFLESYGFVVKRIKNEDTGNEVLCGQYGFVAGIHAGNYDITKIYIDSLYKVSGCDDADAAPVGLAENGQFQIFTVGAAHNFLPSGGNPPRIWDRIFELPLRG